MNPPSAPALDPPLDYSAWCARVRECERQDQPLFVSAGGGLGDRPPAGAAVLDLRPLQQVVQHAHADLTITVQAGMSFAQLARTLAAQRQELPLDVPRPQRTTIGAALAANLSGSRRLGCGTPRDLLIGLRTIGGGGHLLRAGGRVVKNVAGYDICKLHLGARGWLGVLLEATFKVAARPEDAGAVAIACPDGPTAERITAALLSGETRPQSIDLLNPPAAQAALAHSATLQATAAGFALLVGYAGPAAATKWQIEACRAAGWPVRAVLDAGAYAAARQEIADLAWALPMEDSPGALRLSCLSSQAATVCEQLQAAAPRMPLVAHLASGVLAAIPRAAELATVLGCAAQHECAWSYAAARGAASQGLGGPPRGEWGLLQAVKSAADPRRIFARGGAFDRMLAQ